MYEAKALRDIGPIMAGDTVIIEPIASGVHIWANSVLSPFVQCDDREDFEILALATPEEKPNYLFWYYVPGFAYHGHHLYLDDLWLNHRGVEKLKEIAELCGRPIQEPGCYQDFCKWFAATYPDGCFYADLEKANV